MYNCSNRNIGYHKRFLYNLGDVLRNTTIFMKNHYLYQYFKNLEETQMLDELVKSLPKSYKRQNGYRMKLCNIQK